VPAADQRPRRCIVSTSGPADRALVVEVAERRAGVQTTAFVADGNPGAPTGTIYTLDFTFSDFGVRFAVNPPPASQIDTGVGVGVQF
jgi:hypothetical protein